MSVASRIPEPLKRLLRPLRHLPDRALHRSRSQRALAGLARRGTVRSAVFICHGNINRSAYAAAVFRAVIPELHRAEVRVRSAGFIGPDRPASTLARLIAERRGHDLSDHRSRIVDAGELAETDLIVVMDVRQQSAVSMLTGRPASEVLIIGDLDPEPIEQRTLQDPYGHPEAVFERVFDRIDRCVGRLAATLWG
jgi:protein-tyrosine-phosphatase